MPKKSNLYIERIYKDQPIACWAIDDEISYRQLLPQYSNFSITGGTIDYSQKDVLPVMQNCVFEKINFDSEVIILKDISSIVLDPEKGDLTISAFIYHTNSFIDEYEIGFIDNTTSTSYFSVFSFGNRYGWQHIYDTFPKSLITSDCDVYIKARTSTAIESLIYVNAISLGQDSEEFCSYTMGYYNNLGQSINLDEYGRNSENNGEILSNQYGSIFVEQGGIPMAYGSYQSIRVKPNILGPSLTFPSNGFLHKNGKYNNYTFECWLRLNNYSRNPIKIFGPVGNKDGIYIEEGFISVYVGPYSQSYFVGKWYRPILVHLEYSPKLITLFVNGERVISIDIDVNKISFSEGEDKWAVYGSILIDPFEIDSIAIYPYTVPSETAKKHFVYGQGVQEFDFSNDKFFKKTVQIDYPYAEYAYNVIYPDTNKWRSGYSINLDTTSTYVKPSSYELPEIISNSSLGFIDSSQWLLDNYQKNVVSPDSAPYITINPNINYDNSSIYFKTLSVIPNRVESVFGVFKSLTSHSNETLFSFINKKTGESLRIEVNGLSLRYLFYSSLTPSTPTILFSENIASNSFFYAGVKISELSDQFYDQIGIFFSDINEISMTVGNHNNSEFTGKIFSINIVDSQIYELLQMSNKFQDGFIVQDVGAPSLINFIGNYSLIPILNNTSMVIDIATFGYWEDCLPLAMFGKNATINGQKEYDLDIVQFNIDCQYKNIYETESLPPYSFVYNWIDINSETYALINSEYASYQDFTNYIQNEYLGFELNTGVRTFITIQHYSDVGQKGYLDFINTVNANNDNFVEINSLNISNTKYEIFDNHTVLIPKDIDFNEYYVCLHIEVSVRGTNTKNMVIKRCEFSSFVYNEGEETRVGTKYSVPIYVFSEEVV